jgi:hypothetical protein
MARIIFCDGNADLVELVKLKGIPAIKNDYFLEASRTNNPVLMTASNKWWTFGGGIDASFYRNFKYLCDLKRNKGGGNERIENICFTITVDDKLRATEKSIRSALQFALDNTGEDETLLISGVGCGIGQFPREKFVELLAKMVK